MYMTLPKWRPPIMLLTMLLLTETGEPRPRLVHRDHEVRKDAQPEQRSSEHAPVADDAAW